MLLFLALLSINAPSLYDHGCKGVKQNVFTKVSAPSIFSERTILGKVSTSNFVVVESQDNPLPSGSRQALDYAIEIWSYLINTNSSSQEIKVFAEWKEIVDDSMKNLRDAEGIE